MNLVTTILWIGIVLLSLVEARAEKNADALPFLTVGRTSVPPVIDGKLNDDVWKNAIEIAPFALITGTGFPKEQTRGYLLYDENNLYLGVECDETFLNLALQKTQEVKFERTERDSGVSSDDCVELFFQPEPEKRVYYHVVVNGRGTVYDARCTETKEEFNPKNDTKWNSTAKVAAWVGEKSWSVELSLPIRDFQVKIKNGDTWRFNIARNRNAILEWSAWSPTGKGFHNPQAFGRIRFGGLTPGTRLSIPRENKIQVTLVNPFAERKRLSVSALTQDKGGNLVSRNQEFFVPARSSTTAQVSYSLDRENSCFFLDASSAYASQTQALRSDYLSVSPATEYEVRARIKAQDFKQPGPGKMPAALYISSYDTSGKGLRLYEPAIVLPTGTYGWKEVTGTWRAPPGSAKILFFLVKWANTDATGRVWLDDLLVRPANTRFNLLSNGSVDKDSRNRVSGWPVLDGITIVPSYVRENSATCSFQISDKKGKLIYASAPITVEIEDKVTGVRSEFAIQPDVSNSINLMDFREFYVNRDGFVYLPLVLRSPFAKDNITDVRFYLEVPDFLRLIDPAPRITVVKKETFRKNGIGYRRYVLKFSPAAVSPLEKNNQTTRVNPLILVCQPNAPAGLDRWPIFHYGQMNGISEKENQVFLHILPALHGKSPRNVLITMYLWGGFNNTFQVLNHAELDAIFRTWRRAGFNELNQAASAYPTEIGRYGFTIVRDSIPNVNDSGFPASNNFPGSVEFLAAHPEFQAIGVDGTRYKTTYCPTYFVSDENGNLANIKKWFKDQTQKSGNLDWDYEVPVLGKSSICFCPRCLDAFRTRVHLPADIALSFSIIQEKYRAKWVDFVCYTSGQIARRFRQWTKEADPKCIFSVYSAYQGQSMAEAYGIDWRYISPHVDLLTCGYGRPVDMVAQTRQASNNRPFIAGEIISFCYGTEPPYEYAASKANLFRRLTDGGSGLMIYGNWMVDARVYSALSSVSGLMADFERFFQSEIDDKGYYTCGHQRKDELVKVTGDGTGEDAAVLARGQERLVFLFNEKDKSRTYQVKNLSWTSPMTCVAYETNRSYPAEFSLTIPPWEVKIFHVYNK